ncbi:MAG: signal peptidase II [Anaerolineaceae bacterium]|nr:MAG: signal peptidase II [Anaerolineaceae bacterium]
MVYIMIALFVFLLDTYLKNYIEQNFRIGEKKDILKGKITIKKEYNSGFCLNLLDDSIDFVKKVSAIAFGIVSLAFLIILPRKRKGLMKLGLSLCIGGAASNLKDRFEKGKVVDYFSFNIKSIEHIVFNLADMFIIIGSFILFLSSLFHPNGTCKKTDKGRILEKDE